MLSTQFRFGHIAVRPCRVRCNSARSLRRNAQRCDSQNVSGCMQSECLPIGLLRCELRFTVKTAPETTPKSGQQMANAFDWQNIFQLETCKHMTNGVPSSCAHTHTHTSRIVGVSRSNVRAYQHIRRTVHTAKRKYACTLYSWLLTSCWAERPKIVNERITVGSLRNHARRHWLAYSRPINKLAECRTENDHIASLSNAR